MRAFQPVYLEAQVAKLQDAIAAYVKQLRTVDLLDQVLLRDVALVAGSNTVSHRLARKPMGMLVPSQTAAGTLRFDRTASTTTTTTCVVTASAPMTADLLFY